MTILSVSGLTLRFGTNTVFENVSFSLNENDKLGIVGVNGSGKSSLFKTILGEYTAEEGSVYLSGEKTVGVLTQNGAFDLTDADGNEGDESATVLDRMLGAFPELHRMEKRLAELEILMEQDPRAATEYAALHDRYAAAGGLTYRSRCASVLSRMGFDGSMVNQPVVSLSGGQKTRLALAVRLSAEPDILMLDEPTNHLDAETLGWLESFLISYKKCVLVISHDRYFLDRVTGKTLFLQNHRAALYPGNYTRASALREADRKEQEKRYEAQKKEIARQEGIIEQHRRWNQAHDYVTIRSREKMIAHMERVERPDRAPRPIQMKFTQSLASGGEVLTVKHLSKSFGEKILFTDVNFLLKKGERVLLIGPNGCGKSTLIKIILGQIEPTAGRIEAGYNVQVGYYDQENQNLDPENTVLDELWDAYPTLPETRIRNTLAMFRFVGEDVYKEVSVLSGGERARLTLAKLILSHMNLLILDEPTNHLDIDSREALEAALEGFDGTVLVVSHDRYLIGRLATRILELKPGEGFSGDLLDYRVEHEGEGYDELLRFKADRRAALVQAAGAGPESEKCAPVSDAKEQYLKNKQAAAEARKKARRIEFLKAESSSLEAELKKIEEELFGPAASDYQKAAELDARRTEAEAQLLADWEELERLEAE